MASKILTMRNDTEHLEMIETKLERNNKMTCQIVC